MMPQRNLVRFPAWNLDHARRQIPPISGRFARTIGTFPPDRRLPNHSFDTRRAGTRFQLEAAPLGRGAARDAAGRAGSLRGPAASFYAPTSTRNNRKNQPQRKSQFNRYFSLTPIYGAFITEATGKVPPRGSSSQSAYRTFSRRLIFGVRPHECQIGSGEEYRPAVRLRHSRVASDFWLAPVSIRHRAKSFEFVATDESLLIRCLQTHRNAFRTAPSDTNAIHSVL
jgi:hypothetical protein